MCFLFLIGVCQRQTTFYVHVVCAKTDILGIGSRLILSVSLYISLTINSSTYLILKKYVTLTYQVLSRGLTIQTIQ